MNVEAFKFPPMRCDNGCGECCGPVLVRKSEYKRVVAYAKKHRIKPRQQGETCPFFQGGKCAVHPARPALCRLFGHTPKMCCPRGYNANVPPERENEFCDRHLTPNSGEALMWLHEAAYSRDQLQDILMEAAVGHARKMDAR